MRIVKYWNQRVGTAGKNAMPSYLAESMLYHAVTVECDYADAVLAFFREAKYHLGLSYASVSCPGDPGNYVDELLEDDHRESALAKVEADLAHAEEAVAESDRARRWTAGSRCSGPLSPRRAATPARWRQRSARGTRA